MGVVVCPQLRNYLLAQGGFSPRECEVQASLVNSRITKVVQFLFGKIAALVVKALGQDNVPSLARFALEAQHGVVLQVAKRDKTTEWAMTCLSYLPYAGVALGVCSGLAASSLELPSILAPINRMKQLEIKYVAYLTPFVIPYIANVASYLMRKESGVLDVIINQFKSAIKKKIHIKMHEEFSLKFVARMVSSCASVVLSFGHACGKAFVACQEVLDKREGYTASLMVLGLGNVGYVAATGFLIPGFDLSGHCMLKIVSAALLSSELKALNQKTTLAVKKRWIVYATLYALSDAILIHNTVARYHTVKESAAGLALGATLVALSSFITRKQPLKVQAER